jgi:hypothetical protein
MITRRAAVGRVFASLAMLAPVPRTSWAFLDKPFPHPEPRPGISGAGVLAAEQLPDKKSVRAAFDAARTYPEIFDGVYCICDCAEGMSHRSLLACFESKQPTGCWGCREQAEFIAPLAREGKTLKEIRVAVDKEFD